MDFIQKYELLDEILLCYSELIKRFPENEGIELEMDYGDELIWLTLYIKSYDGIDRDLALMCDWFHNTFDVPLITRLQWIPTFVL